MSTDNAGEGLREPDPDADGHTHETGGAWYLVRWSVPGCPACTPPAEPDAGDADGLARVLRDLPTDPMLYARLILASDWLATREREAEQRGAEKAAERIAQAIDAETVSWEGIDEKATTDALRYAVRIARADATRSR